MMKIPMIPISGSLGSGKTTLLRHLVASAAGPARVQVEALEGAHEVSGELFGEELDMDRHELVVDANAVTLHRFALERVGRRWRAFVVLEI